MYSRVVREIKFTLIVNSIVDLLRWLLNSPFIFSTMQHLNLKTNVVTNIVFVSIFWNFNFNFFAIRAIFNWGIVARLSLVYLYLKNS